MTKYRIKVHVEFVECDDTINNHPTLTNDGSFSMTISAQDSVSIDMCEKSLLQTAYPSIRDALSKHLSEISKKNHGNCLWTQRNSDKPSPLQG